MSGQGALHRLAAKIRAGLTDTRPRYLVGHWIGCTREDQPGTWVLAYEWVPHRPEKRYLSRAAAEQMVEALADHGRLGYFVRREGDESSRPASTPSSFDPLNPAGEDF
ncbi:hypothetical protein [Oerskovia paurometabola]|uniref:hypothetical protein n=1 Tax=Oerskovia paurometabola TaxID=162170 RepID=UPI00380604AA